jgi:hypothetical protein
MSSTASLTTRSAKSTPCSPGAGQNSACHVAASDQKPRPTADAYVGGDILLEHARTLELLAGAMVALTEHDGLSRETVRRA